MHGIGVALADPKAIEQLVISQGVQYRISHARCIVLHCSCRTELIRARVLEGVELACAIPMHIEECTPMPSGLIAQRSIGVETTMPALRQGRRLMQITLLVPSKGHLLCCVCLVQRMARAVRVERSRSVSAGWCASKEDEYLCR